ncbi:hypothetical protein AB0E56_06900 [Microbacterium sp. NPDC028030]|uniref:hypothetical protein n=1 Tax=Microbacterium sp. NPDC028030 TaxID=3155124 RepID=UPI0033D7B82F
MFGKRAATSAIAVIAIAGLAGLAAPAYATEREPITATAPETVQVDPYAAITERLERMVGTQSEAELQVMSTDTWPAELLVGDDGDVIAGYYVEPAISVRAISVRGPGCAVGDACAYNGTNNGWFGTGQMDISISGVTRISSGSYNTTFWRSGAGDNLAPNKSTTFTSSRSYYGITRS